MYLKWGILQIKRNICSITFWSVVVILMLTYWICSYVEGRHSDDTTVLLCSEDSNIGDDVIDRLCKDSLDGFRFELMDGREEIYTAIARGEATCGFVFTEDFDSAVCRLKPDGEVLLLQATDSFDGLTVREVIYPAILSCSSSVILEKYLDEIEAEDDAKEKVLQYFDEITKSKSLKIYDLVNIEATEERDIQKTRSAPLSFGIMTAMLLISVVITCLESYRVNRAFFRALNRRARTTMCFETGIINFFLFLIPLFVLSVLRNI